MVHWSHVSTVPTVPVRCGYRILVPEPTKGLFPASMAVTRVAVEAANDEMPIPHSTLLTDPRNEFLQWNRALDDQMAISEVFPVRSRDLGGGEADPQQILAAFRALHARLGLVYAVNELSRTESEMFGVLYDTKSSRPVASFHTQAVSAIPPERESCQEPADMWETDSRALVRERFERLVHACIRELILRDEPETVEPPPGWIPAGPTLPAEWPPRRFRTGR